MEEESLSIQQKFGKAVRMLRLKRKLSQIDVVKKSGIDLKYLSNIENGKRNVSLDVISRLAKVYHIKASQLFVLVEKI